ncbi:MAG: hypothetical protein OHK006_18420 [Thermodesulfovibrionales bacterium]
MLNRVQENFRNGIDRLKWFSGVFADRLKVEIALVKILYRSNEMRKTRDELLRRIGERVVELSGHPDKQVLKDTGIAEALAEIGKIDREIEECRQKADELGRAAD